MIIINELFRYENFGLFLSVKVEVESNKNEIL